MAWTIVKWGNYNSRIYVNYTFAADTTNRTWTLTANLRITIPSGYTFGPWNNTNAHSATLQANGMASLGAGDHDLTTSRQIASGTYDDDGTAPSVDVSWAFNVNSSWGGYENPYGTVTLTGSAIEAAGGKIHVKVSNVWKTGYAWVKVNGAWKKAKKVWIKINGTWKQAK